MHQIGALVTFKELARDDASIVRGERPGSQPKVIWVLPCPPSSTPCGGEPPSGFYRENLCLGEGPSARKLITSQGGPPRSLTSLDILPPKVI